ncbi:MAG TPA: sugar ABC transporter substrate-binding protein [Actinopolymorphaceae bacterium]
MKFFRGVRTTAVAAVTTAALALAFSGCSNQAPEETQNKDDKAGAGQTEKTDDLTFAVVTHSKPGDPFWDIVKSGADQGGKEMGVTVTYTGDGDPAQQSQLIDNAVSQKVDGLIVSMANPDGVRGSVEKAVEAGIPVITINSGLEQSKQFGAITHVGQSEELAGVAAGERLKAEGLKKVLCVVHEQGNVGLEQRCAGAGKGLGRRLTPVVVDISNVADAQNTIKSQLLADKSIDGVLTLNPDIAKAAVQAKQEAQSSARLATFDVSADICDAIEAGDLLFAVDQQPYLQGYLPVVMLALKHRNGNDVGGGQPVYSGPGFVTKENAAQVKQYARNGTR